MGVRLRFTLLYGVMFLVTGAGLVAIVALVGFRGSRQSAQVGGLRPELAEQLTQHDEIRARQLMWGAVLALLIMLVVALLLGRVAAGRVLRPLRVLTAATRRISAD